MSFSDYSVLPGDDDANAPTTGGLVPLNRDAVSDSRTAAAAPAATSGGVGTSAMQKKLQHAVHKTVAVNRLRDPAPERTQ